MPPYAISTTEASFEFFGKSAVLVLEPNQGSCRWNSPIIQMPRKTSVRTVLDWRERKGAAGRTHVPEGGVVVAGVEEGVNELGEALNGPTPLCPSTQEHHG
jgi:hypothetical protein